jgi:hypothetical protein
MSYLSAHASAEVSIGTITFSRSIITTYHYTGSVYLTGVNLEPDKPLVQAIWWVPIITLIVIILELSMFISPTKKFDYSDDLKIQLK